MSVWAKQVRIASGGVDRARSLRRKMTFSETLLWKALRKLEFNIRRQVPIGPFVADFACLAGKLIVEVDGGVHRLPEVQVRDAEREAWFKAERFRVLRFSAKEVVNDLPSVLARIEAALTRTRDASGGSDKAVPLPLEGGGAGVGVNAERREDGADGVGAERGASPKHDGHTPIPDPSPLEGEGRRRAPAPGEAWLMQRGGRA